MTVCALDVFESHNKWKPCKSSFPVANKYVLMMEWNSVQQISVTGYSYQPISEHSVLLYKSTQKGNIQIQTH